MDKLVATAALVIIVAVGAFAAWGVADTYKTKMETRKGCITETAIKGGATATC